jgi:DNA polymerase/3'-5' exonuclease PolX
VIGVLREKGVLKVVDDILISSVGDGGSHLEEAPGVGPQGLVHLLLNLGQVMTRTCSDHGSLEVVNEGLLRSS